MRKAKSFYNETPNFSVVMPGGCRCSCSFCFLPKVEREFPKEFKSPEVRSEYLKSLGTKLKELPAIFSQVSITGGEPLISPVLKEVLPMLRERFKKVVFTTNGLHFDEEKLAYITDYIDHLNISIHHFVPDINSRIMGTSLSIDGDMMKKIVAECNRKAIDININCVLTEDIKSVSDIMTFIHQMKMRGASSVCFRHPFDVAQFIALEENFKGHKVKTHAECPVCRSDTMILDGVPVTWKSSNKDPMKYFDPKITIYEVVFKPDGQMYLDWANKNAVTSKELNAAYTEYIGKIFVKKAEEMRQLAEFIGKKEEEAKKKKTKNTKKEEKISSLSHEDLDKLMRDIAKYNIRPRDGQRDLDPKAYIKYADDYPDYPKGTSCGTGGC